MKPITREASTIIVEEAFKYPVKKRKEKLINVIDKLFYMIKDKSKPKTTFWHRFIILQIGFFFGSMQGLLKADLDMSIIMGTLLYIGLLFAVLITYEIGRIVLGKKKNLFDD